MFEILEMTGFSPWNFLLIAIWGIGAYVQGKLFKAKVETDIKGLTDEVMMLKEYVKESDAKRKVMREDLLKLQFKDTRRDKDLEVLQSSANSLSHTTNELEKSFIHLEATLNCQKS